MVKYAFITGASRGIGAAIAEELAKNGYHLYLTCKNSADLLCRLAAKLEETYSISCTCFVGDISDYHFVSECFSSIQRLDVLINNAGISYVGLLSEMDVTDWNQVIGTNLSSAFYTSKLAIPLMLREKSGKIINISSMNAYTPLTKIPAYSGAKAAISNFTQWMAVHFADVGIRVNAIAPGYIMTDMMKTVPEDLLKKFAGLTMLGRLGQPEEIAKAALFLASDDASYVTGHVLSVNGGMRL